MSILNYLEETNPTQEIIPRSQEQKEAHTKVYFENKIQISFWDDKYTFQNGNNAPITGIVSSYNHRAKLTIRAMELARNEEKEYTQKSGMDTLKMIKVSNADIENTKNELRRYGAEI